MKRWELMVKGNWHEYGFTIHGTDEDAAKWRADGLHVEEIINTIPVWVPWWGIRAWCWAEDQLRGRG